MNKSKDWEQTPTYGNMKEKHGKQERKIILKKRKMKTHGEKESS